MYPDECSRPVYYLNPKEVADAIEAGWMMTGFWLGSLSGSLTALIAGWAWRR